LETTPAHDSGGGFSSDLINKDINYRRLKASNVIFYSQLPHSAKLNGDSLWHVACQILSKMHGLKDLSIIMDHDRYCPRSGTIEDDIFEPMKPLYRKDLNKFTAYLDWRPIFDTSDPALPPQVLGPPPSLPVHQSLPSKL
jgi:hypothetical protein